MHVCLCWAIEYMPTTCLRTFQIVLIHDNKIFKTLVSIMLNSIELLFSCILPYLLAKSKHFVTYSSCSLRPDGRKMTYILQGVDFLHSWLLI